MVLCEGIPGASGASCPEQRNDSSVTLSKGNLMLCLSCEEHRFPELYRNKAVSAAASAVDVKTKTQPLANPNSESEKEVVYSDCKLVQCELLFFVMGSYSQHPEATIKSTILEFYREDEILQAKQVLIHYVEHVEGLNTQSFVKKRSGVNKLKSSVDDIMNIVKLIDEQSWHSRLVTMRFWMH